MNKLTTLEESQQTENKTITIVPRYGLQQGAVYVEPIYDSATNSYLGIPHNWEELRRQGINTVTPEDSFKFNIPSGVQYTFDLSNVAIAQKWNWIKHHPVIALSRDGAIEPGVLLYVEDADAEMEKIATVKKEKFLLEKWVRELPSAKQSEVARLLGQRTAYMKPVDIEDYLVEQSRSGKYADLKAVKEDVYFKTKLFLFELEDKKIITSYMNGYKYGDTILGLDIPSVIHWLNTSDNREIVLQWKRQINMGFEGENFSLEKELDPEKKKPGRPALNSVTDQTQVAATTQTINA